ncbi:hypothetical protein EB231_22360 [Mesorhizobium sp. NZP2298]|nr:hypothetical protein EB231_22360 [Mesorhizobium sp. NZP2298]
MTASIASSRIERQIGSTGCNALWREMLMLFIDVSSCVLLACLLCCLLSGRTYKSDHSTIELNFP